MNFISQEELSRSDSTDIETLSENTQIKIAYLVNPDPVIFNDLDEKIIEKLKLLGAEIIEIDFENIFFKFGDTIQLYFKDQLLHIDGFISYGYMSPQHMTDYAEIIQIFEQMGVVCLYTLNEIEVFSNKLKQATYYSKNKVPIPDTFHAFSVKSAKSFYHKELKNKSIIKLQTDYGGDGVKINKNPAEGITTFSKFQWNNNKAISQELIPGVWGRSIRVLLINGQPFACAEYNDQSGDFRSNFSFLDDSCKLISLEDHPKLNLYYEIAKKAVESVSKDIMIVGVDLLDSEQKGIVVLEANIWPDMEDIQNSTKKPVFDSLVSAFYDKIQQNVNKTKEFSSLDLPVWINISRDQIHTQKQKIKVLEI